MNILFSLIVAISKNGIIGNNNQIPWNIPSDLRRFKSLTLNKPIIMGRKTWVSLKKRPLINRINIVLSKNKKFKTKKALVFYDLYEAYKNAEIIAKINHIDEIFFIGGVQIFEQSLPLIQKMYITTILKNFHGDAFFPKINYNNWSLVLSKIINYEKDDYESVYKVYKKCKK